MSILPRGSTDYSLQQKIFNGINPAPGEGFYGPSPYPPFVALFFSLFARLPFNWALMFSGLQPRSLFTLLELELPSEEYFQGSHFKNIL